MIGCTSSSFFGTGPINAVFSRNDPLFKLEAKVDGYWRLIALLFEGLGDVEYHCVGSLNCGESQ